jgi:hypothetical protein
MKKQCENPRCMTWFEPKRSTAKYCSDNCKMAVHRGVTVTDKVMDSVTGDDSVTVTDSVTPAKSGPVCGHCLEPVPIASVTCCGACSMAGKGKVSQDRKQELSIGEYYVIAETTVKASTHPSAVSECQHVKQAEQAGRNTKVNTGPWLPQAELAQHQVNRVSLPGDTDYA